MLFKRVAAASDENRANVSPDEKRTENIVFHG